ncbi:hypothetical protein GXG07_22325 [Escherichia coli]|nr:hypothetical protein [Escherichia coli]
MNNNRNFAVVFINDKEYQYLNSFVDGELYFVVTKKGVARRLKTPKIIAAIKHAVIELAHDEAIKQNEQIDWERQTPAQKNIHNSRVMFGIELKVKYQVETVLEACYLEALEMDKDDTVTLKMGDECSKHATVKDALEVFKAIENEHSSQGLGSSSWPYHDAAFILTKGLHLRISYNGRLWHPDGTEYTFI